MKPILTHRNFADFYQNKVKERNFENNLQKLSILIGSFNIYYQFKSEHVFRDLFTTRPIFFFKILIFQKQLQLYSILSEEIRSFSFQFIYAIFMIARSR